MNKIENKKLNGQFFTITNPFVNNAFYTWFNKIDSEKKKHILEPFSGANNIVKLIDETNLAKSAEWHCYDIQPSKNNVYPKFEVIKQDTIKKFPNIDDCYIAITNPPYLAKNSATRSGLKFEYPEYDDLYKKCLEVMLNNCEYVAAIIPESFITSGLFINRCQAVVSLTCKMFDDTECPVCLALFSPENEISKKGFIFYRLDEKKGYYQDLLKMDIKCNYKKEKWTFNDPNGNVGIYCCDNNKEPSIKFVNGSKIDSSDIKITSRAITRVSGLPKDVKLKDFIENCNKKLNDYRTNTCDMFLTSFKGLRKDNCYRRRLDFKVAKNIMSSVLMEMQND